SCAHCRVVPAPASSPPPPLSIPPTRPPPRSPLFPYTTLFRSERCANGGSLFHPLDAVAAVAFAYFSSRKVGQRVRDCWMRLRMRSEEHTSELQSRFDLVCRLLLEKKTSV